MKIHDHHLTAAAWALLLVAVAFVLFGVERQAPHPVPPAHPVQPTYPPVDVEDVLQQMDDEQPAGLTDDQYMRREMLLLAARANDGGNDVPPMKCHAAGKHAEICQPE